jgi:drug/metabolite transporter (DMT)-like permease
VVTTTSAVPVETRVDPRLIACLAAVYLIWSSTYLAIRVAVAELPPLLAASMRFLAAGSAMLAIARRRGAAWPALRDWLRAAPVGTLLFLGGNGCLCLAEASTGGVSSGGTAVVSATMPLWVGVLGALSLGRRARGDARPTAREWLALALGFGGVVVLMNGPSLAGDRLHVALAIASPILWGTGSLLARRTKGTGGAHAGLVGPSLQMLTGGVVLLAVSLARGSRLPLHASTGAWLALAYLVVFGSLLGFTAYMWLLRNARPAVATSYAFVNPVLAVLIGAALYGEPLGWTTLVANGLIVAAVILVLRPRRAA